MKKKYDLVIGIGCSFMNGDAILDENNKAFGWLFHTPTKYLADKLECEYKNLAQSGSSNERIFFNLFDFLENKGHDWENKLVIIGLSELARYMVSTESDLHPHHLTDLDNIKSKAKKKFSNDVDGLSNFVKFYMTHIYDNDFELKKLGQKIKLFSYYLEKNNIDYIIFNSLSGYINLDHILDKKNTIIFDNNEKIWYNYLRKEHHKNVNTNFNLKEYRSPSPPHGRYFCNGHPSPGANKDLADLIYKKLQENEWI